MDWERVVEGNAKRLQRILAMLVAMAGLRPTPSSPLVGEDGSARRGEAETLAGPGEGCCEERGPATLTRRLHRAILRQLRPLESATRRLIIVAARDLPVPALPASGIAPASPAPSAKPASPTGSRIVSINLGLAGCAPAPPPPPPIRRTWSLPLTDPRKRFGPRRKYVPAHAAPRIIFFDGSIPHKLPPPPGPHDQIDATRLGLRFRALASALDDLPGQARRFARWKARNARARNAAVVDAPSSQVRRFRRISPLRPGRAPGWRTRSKDEINEVLADMQYFAREVLNAPDTS